MAGNKTPKWPLRDVLEAVESVGLRLGKTRALDIILVHIPSNVRAQQFAEKLVLSLRTEHFHGTKVLEPPLVGEYDEYCLALPASLEAEFELDPDVWYVGLKFNGSDVTVFCISMHPSTKPGAKK